ncbi:unnamed protein product [Urochloa decumbens]|uniref:CRAL/TRIO N-terminal domain-containing protein n=1 Tax=Urochloa decumbens TaxID=240449 RepID=A0ABC8Z1Q6_9POAL
MASAGGGAAGEGEWLKVAELRAVVQAQDPRAKEVDNLTLRRFLRARDHNVEKAAAMFLKFLKWRREAAPDGFVPEERVRRELAQDKAWMGGVDRAGRPILVGFLARHYSADRDMAEYKSFVVYFFDKICARIPRGQEKFLAIVDLQGWGYANCDVRAYIASIEIMQNLLNKTAELLPGAARQGADDQCALHLHEGVEDDDLSVHRRQHQGQVRFRGG